MTETFNKLHRLLNAQGKTVQMLGRLGYAEIVPPSPRWPVESKIIRSWLVKSAPLYHCVSHCSSRWPK